MASSSEYGKSRGKRAEKTKFPLVHVYTWEVKGYPRRAGIASDPVVRMLVDLLGEFADINEHIIDLIPSGLAYASNDQTNNHECGDLLSNQPLPRTFLREFDKRVKEKNATVVRFEQRSYARTWILARSFLLSGETSPCGCAKHVCTNIPITKFPIPRLSSCSLTGDQSESYQNVLDSDKAKQWFKDIGGNYDDTLNISIGICRGKHLTFIGFLKH